jgi:predicted PhzF superfamily epimerase YddE/YHI9
LLDAVGSSPQAFWRSKLGYAVVLVAPSCLLDTMGCLANQLEESEAQGLVVMQAVGADAEQCPMVLDRRADYQLRFFAPGLGIPEDPVTGSAHALVAPYWMQICSRSDVVGWQCSPRPGGMVCERLEGDREEVAGGLDSAEGGAQGMSHRGVPGLGQRCRVHSEGRMEHFRFDLKLY